MVVGDCSVSAQASRTGKRWAYVLRFTSGESYVSEARWGNAEAAISAGAADALASGELEKKDERHVPQYSRAWDRNTAERLPAFGPDAEWVDLSSEPLGVTEAVAVVEDWLAADPTNATLGFRVIRRTVHEQVVREWKP